MQTYQVKRIDFVSLLASDLDHTLYALRTPRCPACETPLKAEPVQVLAEWRDWHAGWQSRVCPHCSYAETRFTIASGDQPRIYQTHPVC